MDGGDTFLYLNRDNRWTDFQWHGLEVGADGMLRLAALPGLVGAPHPALAQLPSPARPASIAVALDGSIYFSVPDSHTLYCVSRCDETTRAVPCLDERVGERAELDFPHGVAVDPLRDALFVADSGNDRVQAFDRTTFQLLGIWGKPGELDQPAALAFDAQSNLYVTEAGKPRIQKFNVNGQVVPEFWSKATASLPADYPLTRPEAIAVDSNAGQIYVLDPLQHAIFVFDTAGMYQTHVVLQRQRAEQAGLLTRAMGLAVDGDNLYVGDNAQRGIYKFKRDGTLVGRALGYEGPVAALALDRRGKLWVLPGSDTSPVALDMHGGFTHSGFAWGGPFQNPSFHAEQWHWLRSTLAETGPDSHTQLLVYRGLSRTLPIPVAQQAPWTNSEVDFADCLRETSAIACREHWVRFALDADGALFEGAPQEYVWVGIEFSGEGHSSPALAQLRLDFDHPLYLQNLPAFYQDDASARKFLARYLTLFESGVDELETVMTNLPALFAPTGVPAAFLEWLSGWLALTLPGEWDDARKRALLSDVFELYALRGTPYGLSEMLRRFTGAQAVIQEPLLNANWWLLGEESNAGTPNVDTHCAQLGLSTMLAPVVPGTPVLDSTAVLDAAHLIGAEEYGAPLFENLAHQFTVNLYRGPQYSAEWERAVREGIEREKPAHTAFALCVIEPVMRIGYQARLGIDSIVGSEAVRSPHGDLLHGEAGGQIGVSQIGSTLHLGEGAGS